MPEGPEVIILTPGGLEHGGGIGRLMGYVVDAWSRGHLDGRVRLIDSRGTGSVLWSPVFLAGALLAITRERLLGRAPLLHLNFTPRASTLRKMAAALWASVLRLRYVLHLHDEYIRYYRQQPRLFRWAIRRTFRSAERVILLGHYWRDFVVGELGVSPGKVDVLWNAVPGPGVRSPVRHSGSDPVRLLYLAHRVEAAKGAPELLEALSDPRMRDLGWTATLAGAGDIAGYRRRVEELSLAGRVEIPGWVDRDTAAHLLKQSDVLLLPSHTEALSMAVLEAMANGLAVVCTDVGALGEVVIPGETGLLVPVNDSKAIADALVALCSDAAYRERLSENARRRHAEHFDIQTYANRLAAIWNRAMRQHDLLRGENATHSA